MYLSVCRKIIEMRGLQNMDFIETFILLLMEELGVRLQGG
jgi:hypothetical protein